MRTHVNNSLPAVLPNMIGFVYFTLERKWTSFYINTMREARTFLVWLDMENQRLRGAVYLA